MTKVWGDLDEDPEYLARLEREEAEAVAAHERWSRRKSIAVVVGASLLLWAALWLAVAAFAAPAHAGYSCVRIGNTLYCNDDNSTRSATCTTIGRVTYCN